MLPAKEIDEKEIEFFNSEELKAMSGVITCIGLGDEEDNFTWLGLPL